MAIQKPISTISYKSYSFYDVGLAEAMYHFVSIPEEYDKFVTANIEDDVSIAEYCLRRFKDFRTYCEKTFGFTVYEPITQDEEEEEERKGVAVHGDTETNIDNQL